MSLRQTPQYEAVAEVLVEPAAAPGETPIPLQPGEMETERRVVASSAVAELVRDELEIDEPATSLLKALDVQVLPDSQVLELAYRSPDPDRAATVVNSFADNYLFHREERGLEGVLTERESVEERLEETDERLTEISQQLRDLDADDPAFAMLESQRNILIGRSAILQERLEDLRAAGAAHGSVGEVIAEAVPPAAPASPDHVFNGILGGLLGLLLGAGAALLKARREDRFRDRADVERVLEAPVLATIPRHSVPGMKTSPQPITAASPGSTAAESYRTLRWSIDFLMSQQNKKTIVMTSSSAGDGKTLTVANLGVAFAQAGKRVVLVSADLRRPTLGSYFGIADVDQPNGLSTWLASGAADPWSLLQDPGIPNMRLLPTGPIPSNPTELLSSRHLTDLITRLEASADLVLFDSPPVLAVSDAAILTARVDGVALVVGPRTDRSDAAQARDELQRLGATIIGGILNSLEPSAVPGYASSQAYLADSEGARVLGRGRRRRDLRLGHVLRLNK